MYTEDQKKMISEALADFNHYFGYANAPEGQSSFTQFYKYDSPTE